MFKKTCEEKVGCDASKLPVVLLYHRISNCAPDNQYLSVSSENFEEHLKLLKKEKNVVPLYDLVAAAQNGHLLENAASITFDDGYADNFVNALPLLEKYECHATIFVTTGVLNEKTGYWVEILEEALLNHTTLPDSIYIPILGRTFPTDTANSIIIAHDYLLEYCRRAPAKIRQLVLEDIMTAVGRNLQKFVSPHPALSDVQLKELAKSPWIEIGSHTVNHPMLSMYDVVAQRNEIVDSVNELRSITSKDIRMIAYPFGGQDSFNSTTCKIVQEANLFGIANIQGYVTLPFNPQSIPRFLVRNWDKIVFREWLYGVNKDGFDHETVRHRIKHLLSHLSTYYPCGVMVEEVKQPHSLRLRVKNKLLRFPFLFQYISNVKKILDYWCRKWRKYQVENSTKFRTKPLSRKFGYDRACGIPIDRVYMDDFLSKNKEAITGRVLEVGDNTYTMKYGLNVKHSDILLTTPSPSATIVGDLVTGANIPTELFDCIILTNVLNFIYDVKSALLHSVRALKKGGTLFITVAGLVPISRYDMDRWGDYWRFTDKGLEFLLEELAKDCTFTVQSYGNAGIARAFIDGRAASEVPSYAFQRNDSDYQVLICAKICKKT